MPEKPLKFCIHAGCDNLTNNKYCDEHKDDELKANRQYNKRRGTSAERGYDDAWRKVRLSYLRTHPLCEMCMNVNKTVPAVLVHHIKPINEGGARLDSRNFMALCNDCHEKIHGKDRWKRRD